MKKVALVAAVAVLALSSAAYAANFNSQFAAGNYEGKITSVSPEINNKPVNMELKQVGDNVVATVTYEGGKEVWTWNDKVLNQQEVDLKANKTLLTYGATAAGAAAGTKQSYNINCKDKTANKCDADVDARNYWVLESAPNTIKYIVYGVDPKKKDDKTLKADKRHEFVFTLKTK